MVPLGLGEIFRYIPQYSDMSADLRPDERVGVPFSGMQNGTYRNVSRQNLAKGLAYVKNLQYLCTRKGCFHTRLFVCVSGVPTGAPLLL